MMTPDHLAYTVPGETDDPAIIELESNYTDHTEPNPRCTDMAEAKHITLRHIIEYVDRDTEDFDVRAACLDADLGFRANRHGLSVLIDTFHNPAPPAYQERWDAELTDYLAGHGIERKKP